MCSTKYTFTHLESSAESGSTFRRRIWQWAGIWQKSFEFAACGREAKLPLICKTKAIIICRIRKTCSKFSWILPVLDRFRYPPTLPTLTRKRHRAQTRKQNKPQNWQRLQWTLPLCNIIYPVCVVSVSYFSWQSLKVISDTNLLMILGSLAMQKIHMKRRK